MSMKEKKSNLKNKEVLQDEQTSSLIRLIGLFMIVYGILCFTSKNMGSILSVPFTFLVGSFSSIALLIVIILGCYMPESVYHIARNVNVKLKNSQWTRWWTM